MAGSKIGAVNGAMRDVLPDIKNIADGNADAEIKIAVMEFSTGADWTHSSLISIEDFYWTDLNASGLTALGTACSKLYTALSRNKDNGGFMADTKTCYAPIIILLSDGLPNDDWKSNLDKLKNNSWFKAAIKVALAVGDEADKGVLTEFTGNAEAVIDIKNPQMLKDFIKFVSITSAQIGAHSSPTDADKATEFAGELEKKKEEYPPDDPDSTGGYSWPDFE
jgi:uncharacterized protein YegL